MISSEKRVDEFFWMLIKISETYIGKTVGDSRLSIATDFKSEKLNLV